jgi:hypothetical protein
MEKIKSQIKAQASQNSGLISGLSSGLSLAVILVLLAIWSRVIPHAPNFSAVGAAGLFAGYVWRRKPVAFLLPLIAMGVSDIFLGWHVLLPLVYGALMLQVFLASFALTSPSRGRLLGVSVLGSTLFFVITNLGVFFWGGLYVPTLAGLTECFVRALPFYKNQLAGDLVFSFAIFGVYQFLLNQSQVRAKA